MIRSIEEIMDSALGSITRQVYEQLRTRGSINQEEIFTRSKKILLNEMITERSYRYKFWEENIDAISQNLSSNGINCKCVQNTASLEGKSIIVDLGDITFELITSYYTGNAILDYGGSWQSPDISMSIDDLSRLFKDYMTICNDYQECVRKRIIEIKKNVLEEKLLQQHINSMFEVFIHQEYWSEKFVSIKFIDKDGNKVSHMVFKNRFFRHLENMLKTAHKCNYQKKRECNTSAF